MNRVRKASSTKPRGLPHAYDSGVFFPARLSCCSPMFWLLRWTATRWLDRARTSGKILFNGINRKRTREHPGRKNLSWWNLEKRKNWFNNVWRCWELCYFRWSISFFAFCCVISIFEWILILAVCRHFTVVIALQIGGDLGRVVRIFFRMFLCNWYFDYYYRYYTRAEFKLRKLNLIYLKMQKHPYLLFLNN